MSVSKRKKAIQKVVKLLNLATSSNSSESVMALRHAESLIRQYQVAQRELPILQLCDRSMLYRVSWGGAAPRYQKEAVVKPSSEGSVYQRRFSEKDNDPSRAYESARTILDDMDLSDFHDVDSSFDNHAWSDSKGTGCEDKAANYNDHIAGGAMDPCDDFESGFKRNCDSGENEMAADSVLDGDVEIESVVDECDRDGVASYTSSDNVINATKAFRPDTHEFAETLKTQYATSDPSVPFVQDDYWSKVYEKLADFDEASVQAEIEVLDKQLLLAQENLQFKKCKRHEHEQGELLERAERARIEQSFEEAIERAFQARAKSYEAWEESCTKIRMARLRDEQEAVQGYDAVSDALAKNKESLKQHLQRKEDYRAAKIMHELRRHLVLAVSGDAATESYRKVIDIMSENGLSLKDLEFSDIKNKSLFIRLLERESALIADVHAREAHTEKMLDKFLTSNMAEKESKASENPIQRIQRLLVAASEGGQFETQKSLEHVIYLMDANDVGVRDIGYGYIKKYSVFIRLINWEAERISSLPEREKFTAQILEEYIQHSVQKTDSERGQKSNR